MNLRYVTITGADDSTSIDEMLGLSQEYPFVEWGILVRKHPGVYRYPSSKWIDELCQALDHLYLNISVHVCGEFTRRLMLGEMDWSDIPGALLPHAQRVQINFTSKASFLLDEMAVNLKRLKEKEIIFQWGGSYEPLAIAMRKYGINSSALFDRSGGRGILPREWPRPEPNLPCGYAGGLGPDNVAEQLKRIAEKCGDTPFWIDMESRVRSGDDSRLDMDKVRRVLDEVAKLKRRINND